MITIQNVSQALHEIETKIFKDLEIYPFQKYIDELTSDVVKRYGIFSMSDKNDFKENSISLAASLTRLISELP